jgi:mono/diheme cytochrome c family protein
MTRAASESRPSRSGKRWLYLLLGIVIGGIVTALAIVLVGMPLALGHRSTLPLEKLYADVAVGLAVNSQAGSAVNPNGQSRNTVEAGRAEYTGSCAVCHGVGGDGKGMFGAQMYPAASDLRTQNTQAKTDAQLFWIIKNGLSFAGMPGFANQYNDDKIWNLVSYVRSLGNTSTLRIADAQPTPTTEQLALADPHGDAVQRGAAIYFANGCHLCHSATGGARGELSLRGGGQQAADPVRRGRRGMPSYNAEQITEAQMIDLITYIDTFRIIK